MSKRILSLLLAIVMALGIFPLSSCGKQSENTPANNSQAPQYATREEWIELLAQTFGLDEFQEQNAYFSDVTADQTLFPYVQSCVEWAVLTDDDAFHPQENATRAFIAETAVLAAELDCSSASGDTYTEKALRYAAEQGIVLSGKGDESVTYMECVEAVNKAQELYLDTTPESYTNIVLHEEVQDFSTEANISLNDNVVTMPADLASQIQEGTVFIVPGYPYGTAVKAESVTSKDGQSIIETVEPDIGEIFEELSFAFAAAPKIEDVVPAQEGIEIVPYGATGLAYGQDEQHVATSLAHTSESELTATQLSKDNPLSFGVNVNLTKGKLEPNIGFSDYFSTQFSQDYEKFFGKKMPDPELELEAGTLLKKAHGVFDRDKFDTPIKGTIEEYEGGYDIIGSIQIRDLYVETSYETKKFLGVPNGIKELKTEIHFEAETSLSFTGKFEAEEKFFSTVVPGPYGIWLEIGFYVYIDFNGEVAVKAVLEHTTNVNFKDGNYKKTSQNTLGHEFDLSSNLASGLKGEVTVKALGIKLVGVSVKAGGELAASVETHTQLVVVPEDSDIPSAMICINVDAHFPVVTIKIGDDNSLADKIGISTEFKLIGRSGALIESFHKTLFHHEISDKGSGNVKECTWQAYEADADSEIEIDSVFDDDNSAPITSFEPVISDTLVLDTVLLTINEGESKSIEISRLPDGIDKSQVRFESTDTSVATVDSNGNVKGVAEGTAQIKVYVSGSAEQYCSVTVLGKSDDHSSDDFL